MSRGQEPAIPHLISECQRMNDSVHYYGLDIREYFAAKALQGLLASPKLSLLLNERSRKFEVHVGGVRACELAIREADALLAALEQPNK